MKDFKVKKDIDVIVTDGYPVRIELRIEDRVRNSDVRKTLSIYEAKVLMCALEESIKEKEKTDKHLM